MPPTAASSSSSRTAACRWAASPSPSWASTAPPGKTQTPAMKRAAWVRRTRSTSSASVPPRSRTTVAAWRGTTSSPVLSPRWPGASMVGPGPARSSAIARPYPAGTLFSVTDQAVVQRWICEACGFIYDPADGDPDGGIPPGTAWEDIPDTWFCPVCGARKKDFVAYED